MEICKEWTQHDRLPTGKFGRKVGSGISGFKLVDLEFVTEVSFVSKEETAILYKSTLCWLLGQWTLAVPVVAAAHLNFYPGICWTENQKGGEEKQEEYYVKR